MAKLTEYIESSRFDSGDILIKDGSSGTRKITAANAAIEFAGLVSPINHRNIYRGKNLGTVITEAQKEAIQSGSYDDLFIGDYWSMDGINPVIADINYWYNCGDISFTKNHLVMTTKESLYNAKMNATNTTEGGYVGSLMYTEGLDQAKATISSAFGDMLLTHREYLVNAVTSGHPSAGAWFDSTVELMNEIMVYGSHIYTPAGNGITNVIRSTIDKQQLSLFRLNPRAINNRVSIWLRDVVSSSRFAFVYVYGNAGRDGASGSYGVRPVFAIG